MRTTAAILGALLLTGCSFLAGGSGEFTVEGTTYSIDKLSCFRTPDGLTLTGSASSSLLMVRLTDAPRPEALQLELGAGNAATMQMQEGSISVQRTGDRFEFDGMLVHTSDSANAAEGTEEPFTAVIECAEIRDLKPGD